MFMNDLPKKFEDLEFYHIEVDNHIYVKYKNKSYRLVEVHPEIYQTAFELVYGDPWEIAKKLK